jgi:hypothetical protein
MEQPLDPVECVHEAVQPVHPPVQLAMHVAVQLAMHAAVQLALQTAISGASAAEVSRVVFGPLGSGAQPFRKGTREINSIAPIATTNRPAF